jgi:CheY-like chemotaxis protein
MESIQNEGFIKLRTGCKCSTILVVDDEPFNVITLKGLLLGLNIEKVDKAFNGREALDKIT